jgi:hypothetical protein
VCLTWRPCHPSRTGSSRISHAYEDDRRHDAGGFIAQNVFCWPKIGNFGQKTTRKKSAREPGAVPTPQGRKDSTPIGVTEFRLPDGGTRCAHGSRRRQLSLFGIPGNHPVTESEVVETPGCQPLRIPSHERYARARAEMHKPIEAARKRPERMPMPGARSDEKVLAKVREMVLPQVELPERLPCRGGRGGVIIPCYRGRSARDRSAL